MSGLAGFLAAQSLVERHFDNQETAWLVDRLLAKQTVTLIYAPSSSGKSFFAQALVKNLASQMRFVVYIDLENRVSDLKRRGIDRFIAEHSNIHYLHRLTLSVSRSELADDLAAFAGNGAFEGSLIVFDGAKHFTTDIDNDRRARDMMDALMCLRDDGATVLVTHHTTKSGGNYQGSKELIDGCDNAFCARSGLSPKGAISFFLRVDKARDEIADAAYLIYADTLAVFVLPPRFTEVDELVQSLALRIMETIEPCPLTRSEIARLMGDTDLIDETLALFDGFLWRGEVKVRGQARKYAHL